MRLRELVRGAAFYALFYLMLAVGGLALMPFAMRSEKAAIRASKLWFRVLFKVLRAVAGVRVEVRGAPPRGRALVGAKHGSMLDVFILFHALEEARFVMKRELTGAPIFGWFALRVGAVPVDRGGGREAARSMAQALLRGPRARGQMVIYPQGTRTPPGEARPWKPGVWHIYQETGLACTPAATNAGWLLPRGLRVRPGVAVVEFLEPIPPGLDRAAFMARLEREAEAASARLGEGLAAPSASR